MGTFAPQTWRWKVDPVMKVALVSPFSFAYFGGVQRHVGCLYQHLKKLGIETKIIVPRQKKEEDYGPEIILLGSSFVIPANATRGDVSWSYPWEVEEILKREKFDLFHHHSLGPFLSFQIIEVTRKLAVKSILTAHANPDKSFFVQNLPIVFWPVFNHFLSFMDGVIAVSQKAHEMVAGFAGLKEIIPNGVDLELFHPDGSKVERFHDGKINILFVGRLDERKGIIPMVEAFARLVQKGEPNLRLLVIGDGYLSHRAKILARAEGVADRIEFLGAVSDEDLPNYYRCADIFCAPSVGAESFGLVLLEAAASGLPVVAGNIPGYREVLTGVGAELLVEPHDVPGLVSKLESLISSKELRSKYIDWGTAETAKYAWPTIAARIVNFYEKILSKK